MKKKSTLLATCLIASHLLFAGTPVIDGVFDGIGVWDVAVGTGDGVAGFNNSNARNFYVTEDDNYVYFGAECRSDDWQQFIFAINTKSGGGSTDPWGRTITYDHVYLPDYLIRGNVGGDFYSQFQVWDGAAWQGISTNINPDKTEMKGSFNASREGFIEIRVPRSKFDGAIVLDVQFIITGDKGGTDIGHGCFDAIPNDNNATSWSAPGNASIVNQYVSNLILPANLGIFAGELRGNNVQLQWNTLAEQNLAGFGIERSIDARTWDNVGFVAAQNNATGAKYNHSVIKSGASLQFYRLKVTDKDGSFVHSKLVVIKSQPKANAELIGNPVTTVINVAIHTPTPERIQAELIDQSGRRVSNTNYQHPGGSSVLQISTSNMSSGSYILRLNGTETHETLRVVKAK